MLRDKILFVIKLQKLQKQVSLCHPSRMWETHPNDYWVFSKMADLLYHSFPGPPLSKMATESNFPCTLGTFRMSNSLPTCASLGVIAVGCPPPILRQTTERYISTPINGLPQDGGWRGGEGAGNPREQVAGCCWPAFNLCLLYWSQWYGEENLRKICLKSRMYYSLVWMIRHFTNHSSAVQLWVCCL